jgi:hypothetical protein
VGDILRPIRIRMPAAIIIALSIKMLRGKFDREIYFSDEIYLRTKRIVLKQSV